VTIGKTEGSDGYVVKSARSETQELCDKLIEAGHQITVRWVTDDTKEAYPDYERTYTSIIDEEYIENSRGGLVLITEEEGKCIPGLGGPYYLISREEEILHWPDKGTIFKSVNEFLTHIIT